MRSFLNPFFEGANAKGALSSALHSLLWLMGMIMVGIVSLVIVKAPAWLIISIVIFMFIVAILIVLAYLYFMINSPDSLRSEKYSLSKMAIERGLVGDDLSGMMLPDDTNGSQLQALSGQPLSGDTEGEAVE